MYRYADDDRDVRKTVFIFKKKWLWCTGYSVCIAVDTAGLKLYKLGELVALAAFLYN